MLASLTTSPSGLEQLWFTLIGVLWLGYFFLEGFDFGVGTCSPSSLRTMWTVAS